MKITTIWITPQKQSLINLPGWMNRVVALLRLRDHWSIFQPIASKRRVIEKNVSGVTCEATYELPFGATATVQWLTTRPVEAQVCMRPADWLKLPPTNQNLVLFLDFIILQSKQLLGWSKFARTPIYAKTRASTNCWVAHTLTFVLESLGFLHYVWRSVKGVFKFLKWRISVAFSY